MIGPPSASFMASAEGNGHAATPCVGLLVWFADHEQDGEGLRNVHGPLLCRMLAWHRNGRAFETVRGSQQV
jgi:hypothetical protein